MLKFRRVSEAIMYLTVCFNNKLWCPFCAQHTVSRSFLSFVLGANDDVDDDDDEATPCVTRLLSTRLSVRRYATRRGGERGQRRKVGEFSRGLSRFIFVLPHTQGLLIDKLMGS